MSKKYVLLVCTVIGLLSISVVATSETGEQNPPKITKKIVMIRSDEVPGKPPWAGGPGGPGTGGGSDEEEGTYKLLKKGVKWKSTPVSYVIDPSDSPELEDNFIFSAISASAEEWDSHTSKELFDNEYGVVDNATFDTDAPDGKNEILFDDYSDPNVIGMCVIWSVSRGPPSQRKIVETDIMFDIDYTWGNAETPNEVMDLQNIATHEFGHASGLDDVDATEETMYKYSGPGETKKRSLYSGDIAGIQKLYGE